MELIRGLITVSGSSGLSILLTVLSHASCGSNRPKGGNLGASDGVLASYVRRVCVCVCVWGGGGLYVMHSARLCYNYVPTQNI